MNSKSISSSTSESRIKAVTTPRPRLVFSVADTLPYSMYPVEASSVPTLSWGIVSST